MIDKLEYILALAQERHFGRAATACGITQPTFSAGIKQLEESFGTLLVERGSRFRGFTEAGERVLVWARRIVGDTRAMRQDVAALHRALSGRLRIAAIPTAMPLLTDLCLAFSAKHPDVGIVLLSRTSQEILSQLDNLDADAGVTYLDTEPLHGMISIPLFSERLCLVCAHDTPLAARTSVTWTDLATRRLCLLTPDMQNRRMIDRAFAAAGVIPKVTLESDSMVALLAHLPTGAWDGILPEQWVESVGGHPNLRSVRIHAPALTTTVGLVVPPRDPPSALAAALMAEAARMSLDRLS